MTDSLVPALFEPPSGKPPGSCLRLSSCRGPGHAGPLLHGERVARPVRPLNRLERRALLK